MGACHADHHKDDEELAFNEDTDQLDADADHAEDDEDEDHHEDDEDEDEEDQYEVDSRLRLHHSTSGAPGASCPCANSYPPSSS